MTDLPNTGDIIKWINDPPERYFLILEVREDPFPDSTVSCRYYTMIDFSTGKRYKELIPHEEMRRSVKKVA